MKERKGREKEGRTVGKERMVWKEKGGREGHSHSFILIH
jgi:hypothetical protein